MKKLISLLITLLCLVMLFSCSGRETSDSGKVKVIAVNFPAYDFARAVCGDSADIKMLLKPGAESHTYEPSAKDVIAIQSCDLFIYTGGESDEWIETILEGCDERVRCIRMIECVDAVEEEVVEGMDAGTEEADEHVYDEHVWTSPVNAAAITDAVRKAMCALDGDNAELYTSNADSYIAALSELDSDLRTFFSECRTKTLIFGDRFPMRYFTDEYGLTYFAAFPGCSSESEPSAATVAFLIGKAKELDVKAVFYIELSNHVIADTIAEAAGCGTVQLNTCHNLTPEQFDAGETYITLMRSNLEVLKTVLD